MINCIQFGYIGREEGEILEILEVMGAYLFVPISSYILKGQLVYTRVFTLTAWYLFVFSFCFYFFSVKWQVLCPRIHMPTFFSYEQRLSYVDFISSQQAKLYFFNNKHVHDRVFAPVAENNICRRFYWFDMIKVFYFLIWS